MTRSVLRVFIAEHCPGCLEARNIAEKISKEYPALKVELIDIATEQEKVPEAVFATPTFMLDDRVVSLGNPGPEDIARWVKEAIPIAVE